MMESMKIHPANYLNQIHITKSYSPTLKKYKSCRVTLNNQQALDFNLQKSKPKYLSPAKSSEKKALFPKNSTLKSLSESIQLTLTYQQKLNNIEHILLSCKQFSEQYGYFYLTEPMVSFNESQKKLECWIHPDKRSKKPLHPIRNLRESESKRSFYIEIKNLLKKLFPTISQPNANTHIDLLINIRQLQKKISRRLTRNNSVPIVSGQTKSQSKKRLFSRHESQKIVQPPTLSVKVNETILQNQEYSYSVAETPRYPNNEQKVVQEYPKNTISTLIQSLKSSFNLNSEKTNQKVKIDENDKNNIKQMLESMKLDGSNSGELSSKILSQFQGLLKSRQICKDSMLQAVSEEIQNILLN